MLRNEAYVGTLWQNRWRCQKASSRPGHKPGRKLSERPRAEQIPVNVPPIVPREAFDRAQKRLGENIRLARRNTKREYLLSGLLKHSCGGAMGGRTHRDITYYYCYMSQKFKAPINQKGEPQPCSCGWVRWQGVEAAVWDTVTDLLYHPELLIQELEKLTQPDSATRQALQEELGLLSQRLNALPKEERRLVEGYRKGLYADFMMREEMEHVKQEQVTAEQRRRELETQLARLDRALSYRGQAEELANRLRQGLDTMEFAERRELLRLLVDEVVFDDGRLTIRTILPLEQLHPIPGRVGG